MKKTITCKNGNCTTWFDNECAHHRVALVDAWRRLKTFCVCERETND